jgi:hypothetical protein
LHLTIHSITDGWFARDVGGVAGDREERRDRGRAGRPLSQTIVALTRTGSFLCGAGSQRQTCSLANEVLNEATLIQLVCNIFPPFGTCLVIGIQRAGPGRRRAPDGYGLGTRTDGPERQRRPSHPPEFRRGPSAHEHGSCHGRHHPLMGTADVNRCGWCNH